MRIQDLDQISDANIDLSQFVALDDPGQTFKATLLQLSDFLQANILNRVFNVGSTLYRVDNRTPNEAGFPGVWAKATADVTLATGKADGTDTGSYTGTNTPAVTLPQHTHTATQASHTHTADQAAHTHTATQAAHSHSASFTAYVRQHCSDGCNEHSLVNDASQPSEGAVNVTTGSATPSITVGSTDTAITVGSATPAITVQQTGTASATMDVRGLHLNGQLWIRTA